MPMTFNIPKHFLFNLVCLLSFLVTVILFSSVGEPYHRGFFCDDESISKPYKDSTVPSSVAAIVGLLLPVISITIIEWPQIRKSTKDEKKRFYKSQWFRWLCIVITFFVVGAGVNVVLTDVGKYTIGRLRPHFFSVCKPDFSKLNCSTGFKKNFIMNYECTGDKHLVKEARLSFPSGHSSFAAYCMVFLILYLEMRMTYCSTMTLFKPLLQFVLLLLAVLCGLSRVSDYKHHWSDVLTGFFIGTCIALFFIFRVLELRHVSNITPTDRDHYEERPNPQHPGDIESDGTS